MKVIDDVRNGNEEMISYSSIDDFEKAMRSLWVKNQIILIITPIYSKETDWKSIKPRTQRQRLGDIAKKERPDGAKAITCYAFTPSERRNKHNLYRTMPPRYEQVLFILGVIFSLLKNIV